MNWSSRQRSVGPGGLHYLEDGAGPALVLIHGVGLRAEAWLGLLPVLSVQFRVIAVDMPGHGTSPLSGAKTFDDFAEALSRFIDGVDGPVCVAGHSMGALLTVELAARKRDKVAAFAALNTVYRRSPAAAEAVMARAEALSCGTGRDPEVTLQRWFGEAPHPDLLECAQACRNWLTSGSFEGYAAAYNIFARSDGPSEATLDRVACPALYLTGGDDPNSTPAMSRALAARAPQATAHVIEGAAHMLPMTHGEEAGHRLAGFFGNHLPRHLSKGL